jgi:curved DNA-binding protein CbpA
MTTLYDDLGVPTTASGEVIRSAYKAKAKKAHPDTGGSPEAFSRLKLAYDTLSDGDRRERYDRTGQTDHEPSNDEATARTIVANVILQLIDDVDVATADLVDRAQDLVRKHQDQVRQDFNLSKARQTKREKVLKRLKRKPETEPTIERVLESEIRREEDLRRQMEAVIKIFDRALQLLKGYTYETDPQPAPSGFYRTNTASVTLGGFFNQR